MVTVFLQTVFICVSLLALTECNGSSGTSTDSAPPPAPPSPNINTKPIPGIALQKIAEGFSSPTFIGNAGDGSNRIFIVEQEGSVRIIRNGTVAPDPFLDIRSRVLSGGERGLFVVVFPRGYGQGKNYFYVNYTGTQGDGDTFISRFRLTSDPDRADAASEQVLLNADQPFANHNGGQMAFGRDGHLYIGMGDGGGAGDPSGNAQNPGTILGKLLRIDVESDPGGAYRNPADNPFADKSEYRPEIWAVGLRNPWRFSFDRLTGNLFIADVGQGAFEEIDVQSASSKGGENYGWDIMEGPECFNSTTCGKAGLTLPVFSYARTGGNCSITGGYVYRGAQFSDLQGVYMYGDFCSGRIWGLRQVEGAWENKLLLESGLAISTFGEDEAGNLYVADYGGGGIYKITVP